MSFLLDTNVLSEFRKGRRCHPRVSAWLSGVAEEDLYLSVLVVGEIRRGIEVIRRRDARQAGRLEGWLARLVRDHAGRILAIDRPVAEEWGRLTSIRSASVVDVLLAATARVHGMTLVTRNLADVSWTGASCLDPFAEAAAPTD
ncbi:MAG TPA: type II toxin-antitoxin system VapC family toxin [Candidatus Binatia bacterium]|nr:type II toxin-antitoxin system VapC family toxin [Candidatus Binatia bacterium]